MTPGVTGEAQCSVCRRPLAPHPIAHRTADGIPTNICPTAVCWDAYWRIADTQPESSSDPQL